MRGRTPTTVHCATGMPWWCSCCKRRASASSCAQGTEVSLSEAATAELLEQRILGDDASALAYVHGGRLDA